MEASDLEQLSRAWREFVVDGRIDPAIVRPEVAASWQRCRAAGISHEASAPKPQVRLVGAALQEAREANREYIAIARPFMKFLENTVRDSGFVLVLSDAEGTVLETFGSGAVLEQLAHENNYVPGCGRDESQYGTNSIALALVTRRPIQVTGPEHYNVRVHDWTCASAPVFDPAGKLLGTITLSGRSTMAHPHTLGMVISAAEAIQNGLREKQREAEKGQVDILLSSILSSVTDALLVTDDQGRVIQINEGAAKMLAIDAERCVGRSLAELFPLNPDVLSLTGEGCRGETMEAAIEHDGTRAYCIVKPYRMKPGIGGTILTLTERREFINNVRGVSGLKAVYEFDHLVGRSPELLRQIDLARVAARQDCRVLVCGETGTGKELFAQAIHNASARRKGPFVAINCAAIPRDLIESELMGYKGGAFTGANRTGQVGKFELADGGTLFLDEIGQMPFDLQAKLLRVLQDSVISRLGDSRPLKVDVRVIAATNEELFEKSRAGAFRQDLYFRLSVVEVSLPPLRQRPDDIPLLADAILVRISSKLGRPRIAVAPEAMAYLLAYPWPGNIRQLENVLEMAAILCEGDVIGPQHLAARLRPRDIPLSGAPEPQALPADQPLLRQAEIQLLRATMRELNGNIVRVSAKLGMSRSTIYRRMKEHGISRFVG